MKNKYYLKVETQFPDEIEGENNRDITPQVLSISSIEGSPASILPKQLGRCIFIILKMQGTMRPSFLAVSSSLWLLQLSIPILTHINLVAATGLHPHSVPFPALYISFLSFPTLSFHFMLILTWEELE